MSPLPVMSYISIITNEWNFFFKDLKYCAHVYIVDHVPIEVKAIIWGKGVLIFCVFLTLSQCYGSVF